jgi:hypothetical protein
MRILLFTFVLWGSAIGSAFAQETLPPPTLSQVRLSADGKSLEVQRPVTELIEERYTALAPVMITEEVGGVVRTKTVMAPEERIRMVTRMKMATAPLALEGIEVRTIKGDRYEPEEVAKLFDDKFQPVIVVERQTTIVDGKEVVQPVKFDAAYRRLFQPETLVVFLPSPVHSAPQPAPPLLPPTPTER